MELPSLEAVPPTCWQYKAEGAANITLYFNAAGQEASVPAPQQAFYRNKVLRLAKIKAKAPTPDLAQPTEAASLSSSAGTGSGGVTSLAGLPTAPLAFAETVMRPLLGHAYVIPAVEVPVSTVYMRALARQAVDSPARPEKRRKGPGVQVHEEEPEGAPRNRVVVMTDHSQLPVAAGATPVHSHRPICVEIKPKCGVAASGGPLAGLPCRYCCHQLVKAEEAALSEGAASEQPAALSAAALVPHLSGYCPLDLYSGVHSRVVRALTSLACSPQNNFRLFVDGLNVPVTAPSTLSLEAALAAAGVLAREAPEGGPQGAGAIAATATPRLDALIAALASVLESDPVLGKLAAVQAADGGGTAAAQAAAATLEGAGGAPSDASDLAAARSCLASYFVAATAKDCSLLIPLDLSPCSLQQAALPSSPSGAGEWEVGRTWVPLPGNPCAPAVAVTYAVAVVDLDPKPVARLSSYAALEQRLANAWAAHGAEAFKASGKACGAGGH